MNEETRQLPPGLKPDGRGARYWSDLLETFEFENASELVALSALVKLKDDEERLEASLKRAGVMVAGSKGQRVLNPVFGELRLNRLGQARLAAQLNLTPAKASASEAGRRMALIRHSGRAS